MIARFRKRVNLLGFDLRKKKKSDKRETFVKAKITSSAWD